MLAVRGDAGDVVSLVVGDPGVVGWRRWRWLSGKAKRLEMYPAAPERGAPEGESMREVGVAVVDDPGGVVGVDGDGDGVVEATGGEAGGAGEGRPAELRTVTAP